MKRNFYGNFFSLLFETLLGFYPSGGETDRSIYRNSLFGLNVSQRIFDQAINGRINGNSKIATKCLIREDIIAAL